MDENAKKKLANAKKLIQQQKYNEALEDLQIMVYKYAKLFQVHLMTGLCYNKMGKDKEAEIAFLEVLDLKPDQSNAMRELCDIYNKRGDSGKSAHYLQMSSQILKKGDPKKYREAVIKLIQIYSKDDNLQKIDPIFKQYLQDQDVIGEDFVKIAEAQFRIGTKNLCFNMDTWLSIGAKNGKIRPVVPAARQAMNLLLVEVSDYLRAVSLQYHLSKQNIADNLVNMRLYFPESASVLMLMLFDEYSVGQLSYSQLLLSEILRLLQAYFDKTDNGYLNLEYTEHETFSVIVLLSFEYLSFFKQFFTLDDLFLPYMSKLATLAEKLQSQAQIREDYRKKIRNFILKECRQLNVQSRYGAIETRLQNLKERIVKLEGSFLEQVIAKIALHCVFNYQKINDLKNMLKLRIKNLKQNDCSPHLYKYYYEYLLRIARVFKALDQQISLEDILNYITQYDVRDRKYYVEKVWFQFCMACKDADKKTQLAQECLLKLQGELESAEKDLKSAILRRIVVMKIYLGDYEVKAQIEAALENERSFQNLQSTGFYYYYQGKVKQALLILKEAFRLNQLHYHTNRLLFLCLLKTSAQKQAIDFLQRIKEGFPSVFWINYILATNRMNQRKFLQAEQFLNTSLQNFEAGVGGFRFYYERVKDLGPFSLQFLVKQNNYGIFYEQIIFPQTYIYEQSKIVSTSYFQERISENRVRLYRQQGELLKILGRIKSALNYLYEGYAASTYVEVDENTSATDLLDICLIKKQYSTLLFYMRQFKQCEAILDQSQALSSYLMNKPELPLAFMEKLDNEIKALAFEISVERLSIMMRFQSFQLIDEYLSLFKSKIVPPSKPSLNFLKNKYQFYILQYMHSRKDNSDLTASIAEFLQFFKLNLQQRCTLTFQTTLFDLKDEQRRAVRECIEDYYIVLYLKKEAIKQQEILHMLQIFSRSNAFLILFGMVTSDLSRKTAAFLKCIQMEKQSTISIDILASLYLKQKNYLAAAKLFLKSLQVDLLNVKCYLGLAICLFCLVCRAIQTKTQGQLVIIEKSLIRINSYMEYLKLQDPSQNYHLLAFLKLLLNNENLNDFQVKFILQSAQRSLYRHKDSLLGQLLIEATSNWGNASIWKGDHHIKMVDDYLKTLPSYQSKNSLQLAEFISNNCKNNIEDLAKGWKQLGKEVLVKNLSKNLNQVCVSVNLSIKEHKFNNKYYQNILSSIKKCQLIFQSASLPDYQLQHLKTKLKKYLFEYIFIDGFNRQRINQLQWQIFRDYRCYAYLAKYSDIIPKVQRQISLSILKDPANEQLRTIFNSWSIGVQGIHLRKPRQLPYKLQILNNVNENSIASQRSYRQLTLLYRDDTAFVLYIQSCWNQHHRREKENVQTWIKQIIYLSQKDSVKGNKQISEKTNRLKLQMLAFLQVKQGIKPAINLSKYQQDKYEKLIWLNRLMRGEKVWSQFKKTFKGESDDFDWWILLSTLSWFTQTFACKGQLNQLLENLSQLTQCPRKQGFIALLKIISLLSYSVESQQQLVDQIIGITNVAQICNGKIAPNSEVIVECFKYFLTSSYDAIDIQLSRAAEKCKIVNYSDKVLINFFEVLKYYKAVESNPNQQGATQSFYYIVDSMICLVQQPVFKGFFMSLKGIIRTLTTIQQGKDRNLKMSILLDPAASHSLLGIK